MIYVEPCACIKGCLHNNITMEDLGQIRIEWSVMGVSCIPHAPTCRYSVKDEVEENNPNDSIAMRVIIYSVMALQLANISLDLHVFEAITRPADGHRLAQ